MDNHIVLLLVVVLAAFCRCHTILPGEHDPGDLNDKTGGREKTDLTKIANRTMNLGRGTGVGKTVITDSDASKKAEKHTFKSASSASGSLLLSSFEGKSNTGIQGIKSNISKIKSNLTSIDNLRNKGVLALNSNSTNNAKEIKNVSGQAKSQTISKGTGSMKNNNMTEFLSSNKSEVEKSLILEDSKDDSLVNSHKESQQNLTKTNSIKKENAKEGSNEFISLNKSKAGESLMFNENSKVVSEIKNNASGQAETSENSTEIGSTSKDNQNVITEFLSPNGSEVAEEVMSSEESEGESVINNQTSEQEETEENFTDTSSNENENEEDVNKTFISSNKSEDGKGLMSYETLEDGLEVIKDNVETVTGKFKDVFQGVKEKVTFNFPKEGQSDEDGEDESESDEDESYSSKLKDTIINNSKTLSMDENEGNVSDNDESDESKDDLHTEKDDISDDNKVSHNLSSGYSNKHSSSEVKVEGHEIFQDKSKALIISGEKNTDIAESTDLEEESEETKHTSDEEENEKTEDSSNEEENEKTVDSCNEKNEKSEDSSNEEESEKTVDSSNEEENEKTEDSSNEEESEKTEDSSNEEENEKTVDSSNEKNEKSEDSSNEEESEKTVDSSNKEENEKTEDSSNEEESEKTKDSSNEEDSEKTKDSSNEEESKKTIDSSNAGKNEETNSHEEENIKNTSHEEENQKTTSHEEENEEITSHVEGSSLIDEGLVTGSDGGNADLIESDSTLSDSKNKLSKVERIESNLKEGGDRMVSSSNRNSEGDTKIISLKDKMSNRDGLLSNFRNDKSSNLGDGLSLLDIRKNDGVKLSLPGKVGNIGEKVKEKVEGVRSDGIIRDGGIIRKPSDIIRKISSSEGLIKSNDSGKRKSLIHNVNKDTSSVIDENKNLKYKHIDKLSLTGAEENESEMISEKDQNDKVIHIEQTSDITDKKLEKNSGEDNFEEVHGDLKNREKISSLINSSTNKQGFVSSLTNKENLNKEGKIELGHDDENNDKDKIINTKKKFTNLERLTSNLDKLKNEHKEESSESDEHGENDSVSGKETFNEFSSSSELESLDRQEDELSSNGAEEDESELISDKDQNVSTSLPSLSDKVSLIEQISNIKDKKLVKNNREDNYEEVHGDSKNKEKISSLINSSTNKQGLVTSLRENLNKEGLIKLGDDNDDKDKITNTKKKFTNLERLTSNLEKLKNEHKEESSKSDEHGENDNDSGKETLNEFSSSSGLESLDRQEDELSSKGAREDESELISDKDQNVSTLLLSLNDKVSLIEQISNKKDQKLLKNNSEDNYEEVHGDSKNREKISSLINSSTNKHGVISSLKENYNKEGLLEFGHDNENNDKDKIINTKKKFTNLERLTSNLEKLKNDPKEESSESEEHHENVSGKETLNDFSSSIGLVSLDKQDDEQVSSDDLNSDLEGESITSQVGTTEDKGKNKLSNAKDTINQESIFSFTEDEELKTNTGNKNATEQKHGYRNQVEGIASIEENNDKNNNSNNKYTVIESKNEDENHHVKEYNVGNDSNGSERIQYTEGKTVVSMNKSEDNEGEDDEINDSKKIEVTVADLNNSSKNHQPTYETVQETNDSVRNPNAERKKTSSKTEYEDNTDEDNAYYNNIKEDRTKSLNESQRPDDSSSINQREKIPEIDIAVDTIKEKVLSIKNTNYHESVPSVTEDTEWKTDSRNEDRYKNEKEIFGITEEDNDKNGKSKNIYNHSDKELKYKEDKDLDRENGKEDSNGAERIQYSGRKTSLLRPKGENNGEVNKEINDSGKDFKTSDVKNIGESESYHEAVEGIDVSEKSPHAKGETVISREEEEDNTYGFFNKEEKTKSVNDSPKPDTISTYDKEKITSQIGKTADSVREKPLNKQSTVSHDESIPSEDLKWKTNNRDEKVNGYDGNVYINKYTTHEDTFTSPVKREFSWHDLMNGREDNKYVNPDYKYKDEIERDREYDIVDDSKTNHNIEMKTVGSRNEHDNSSEEDDKMNNFGKDNFKNAKEREGGKESEAVNSSNESKRSPSASKGTVASRYEQQDGTEGDINFYRNVDFERERSEPFNEALRPGDMTSSYDKEKFTPQVDSTEHITRVNPLNVKDIIFNKAEGPSIREDEQFHGNGGYSNQYRTQKETMQSADKKDLKINDSGKDKNTGSVFEHNDRNERTNHYGISDGSYSYIGAERKPVKAMRSENEGITDNRNEDFTMFNKNNHMSEQTNFKDVGNGAVPGVSSARPHFQTDSDHDSLKSPKMEWSYSGILFNGRYPEDSESDENPRPELAEAIRNLCTWTQAFGNPYKFGSIGCREEKNSRTNEERRNIFFPSQSY